MLVKGCSSCTEEEEMEKDKSSETGEDANRWFCSDRAAAEVGVCCVASHQLSCHAFSSNYGFVTNRAMKMFSISAVQIASADLI